ncbi:DNA oxidative demethylase AlkB [Hyphomicrobium sp. 2TAF46]|uniref:DNA oxidative demethylase AlkB n=1 Tax=Hyphomicrobium sp. 2TAF46 TaxID=3233019 RepID=UPI003F8FB3EA
MATFSSVPDLFAHAEPSRVKLGHGAVLLRGFARDKAEQLLEAIENAIAVAPFRNFVTPGGHTMSVAMSNCGSAGWVADRRGYRYDPLDPSTQMPWPAMPDVFTDVARRAAAEAGFDGFAPDACLINRYDPGARLTLHQDRNERNFGAPIVSVSLGLPAKFLFGGLTRTDKVLRLVLEHGDVVAWGGPSRLAFHGVDVLKDGVHPATGRCRINLTFREAL